MLIIAKKGEEEFRAWSEEQRNKYLANLEEKGLLDSEQFLSTELGFLSLLCEFDGKPLTPEAYQSRFLLCRSPKRIILKSRRVGYSFIFGAESLARCHLKSGHVSNIVSYNQEDSKEKILVAKELYHSLPLEYQKKLVTDNKKELGFRSNNRNGRLSRIVSYPAKAPRGKGGDVYLDELAHAQRDNEIYNGSIQVMAREEDGQLTIASTPLGQRGKFWEIYTEDITKYPGFWRQHVPWWLCSAFCNDIKRAAAEAPKMRTDERIEEFGTDKIIIQREGLTLEYFQQEFECDFQDESMSFFPYEIIQPCAVLESKDLYDSAKTLAMNMAKRGTKVCAGYDIGRKRHPAALVVAEKYKSRLVYRMNKLFRNMNFEAQKNYLSNFIDIMGDKLEILRIDATGMGMQIAEELRRKHPTKVVPISFSNKIKAEIATQFKILLQGQGIKLPNDRELKNQIHSIKQKITSSGNTVYDAEKNKNHHGDLFWALGLATWRQKQVKQVRKNIGVTIIGRDRNDEESEKNKNEQNKNEEERQEGTKQKKTYNKYEVQKIIETLKVAKQAYENSGNEQSAQKTGRKLEKFKQLLRTHYE